MSIAVQSVETLSPKALDRAFYFIVVLWGERFREYFLEYCVPSLLAPGNIPSLNTKPRSKFLIATRPEDWQAINDTAIFDVLRRYVDPVYIEIPPCPPGLSGCVHMNTGHKIACDMAFREKGLGLVITPDCMFSDGSIARLQELARNGVQLVLAAALRFGEEPLFEYLKASIPAESRSRTGQALTLTGRQLAQASVNSFHTETLSYEWNAPYINPISPAAWWRVPGEDGVVLHCMSWAPVLLDYAAVARHDMSTLDDWTIDGDYLFKNVGTGAKLHVIQDSDELFLASWGPMSDRPFEPLPLFKSKFGRILGAKLRAMQFQTSFHSPVFDPLKRQIFFLPVRWHSGPLNQKWTEIEGAAMSELLLRVKPPIVTALSSIFLNFILVLIRWIAAYFKYRDNIKRRLMQALRGDKAAWHRILWNVRREMQMLARRLPTEPPPPAPKS